MINDWYMRTTKDKPITPAQLKALHATFHRVGLDDDARHECIASFTGGRTTSSRNLTMNEARLLLSRLNEDDERTRQMMQAERRKLMRCIYALSFDISWLNQGFSSDTEEDRLMNYAKINRFCLDRTRFHKAYMKMTVAELEEVKKQLEAIARKEKGLEK